MTRKGKKELQASGVTGLVIAIRIAIVLLILVLYGQTVRFDFALDDNLFLVMNKTVQKGFAGIPEIFTQNSLYGYFGNSTTDDIYRPVTLTSFAIQYQLFGLQPAIGHLINILLYIVSSLLVFSVLLRAFGKDAIRLVALLTVIYIVHPVHSEVVCNIKGRDELLSAVFGFLFIRELLISVDHTGNKRMIPAMCWLLLALFSKESSVIYFALGPLFLYFFRGVSVKSALSTMLPFLSLAALFLLVRYAVLTEDTSANKSGVLFNGLNSAGSMMALYATRFIVLLLFLKMSILPLSLSWDYSYNQIPATDFGNPLVICSVLLHVGLLIVAIRYFKKRHLISFGLLFYFISSSVTNNFIILVGATFAERFLFIPVIGIGIALAGGGMIIFNKNSTQLGTEKSSLYAFLALSMLYFAISFSRIPDWKNNKTILEAGVKTSPNSARAHAGLADYYRELGEKSMNAMERRNLYNQAEVQYGIASDIYMQYPEYHFSRGYTMALAGDSLSALKYYKETLDVDPLYKRALHNIASIYIGREEYDSALVYLKRLYQAFPEDKATALNLGYVYLMKRQFPNALQFTELSMKLDPENALNYRNLASIYHAMGKEAEAIRFKELYRSMNHK